MKQHLSAHADTMNMTEGPLAPRILLFSLPLVFSNVLQVLFNMSDVAVVGRFAGPEALGSVGSTSILVSIFTGFLLGLGSGVNVIIARYLGGGFEKDVREAVSTALAVCAACGLVLMAAGESLAGVFLRLLGTKEELFEGALLYLRIYFLGIPALAVYNFGKAVFSAAGDTRRPLMYLSAAGVLNLLLNLLLVIVFHLDVAGVAIASAVSQALSAFLIIRALLRSREVFALKKENFVLQPSKARMVLALGIPAGIQCAIFGIANLFVQAGVNTFDTVMVEGNSAAANADALVYDVMAAFYTACASFMGQNYGAHKADRMLRSFAVCIAYSFGVAAVMGILLVVFGRSFLGIFTAEPAVVEAGMKRLTIMGFSYCVSAFMDCTISASRSLGRSAVPMAVVFMGSCVFRILWVKTIFAYFKTIPSLYLLYVFSWTLTAAAEILYFVHAFRQQTAGFAKPAAQ